MTTEARTGIWSGALAETGLVYVSALLLLLSTWDMGIVGLLVKLVWIISFALLCYMNIGSALGIYIVSVVLYNPRNTVAPGPLWEEVDIIALLILVVACLLFFVEKRRLLESKRSILLIGIFVVALMAQAAVNGNLTTSTLAEFLRMFGLPFGIYILFRSTDIGRRELDAFFKVMMILGIYLAVVAVLERLNLTAYALPGWIGDPEINARIDRGRSGGPFMQPEFNGLALGLIMAIYWGSAFFSKAGSVLAKYLGILACLIGIYLTYTRAAWLAVAVAVILLISARSDVQAGLSRKAAVLLPLLILIGYIVISPSQIAVERVGDIETVNSRATIWGTALRMVTAKPLFGYGFGRFNKIAPEFKMTNGTVSDRLYLEGEIGTHNIFMNILAEQGLFGLVLYGLILAQFCLVALKGSQTVWPQAGKLWMISFVCIYFINAQFVNVHEPATNLIFYGALGLFAGLSNAARDVEFHHA